MPIRIRYDQDAGFLRGWFEGSLHVADVEGLLEEMRVAKSFSPDVDILWDATGVDFETITMRQVRGFVGVRRGFKRERGNGRTALVVTSDLGYGLARMYQLLADGLHGGLGVFRSLEEAEQWLVSKQE